MESEKALAVVLSRPGSDGNFRGLLVGGGDWHLFSFHADLLALYSTTDEADQIRWENGLKGLLSFANVRISKRQALAATKLTDCVRTWNLFRSSLVNNGALLLSMEAKLATRPRFCVGVVLGVAGQSKEADMFENTSNTPEFDAFLSFLGDRIEISKWKHWRGTFAAGEEQSAVYTSWRGKRLQF